MLGDVCQGRTVPAPTLTDGPLTLRGHRDDDADALVEQHRDPDSERWTTAPTPYRLADARAWIESCRRRWEQGPADGAELTFVVEADGRYAGQVGLRPDGVGGALIGFGLHPAARGRGVMSGAVRMALVWGFSDLGLDVVQWRAYVGNWASRRVAWATGFRVEGTVRALEVQRGRRRDAWIGTITAGDVMRPTAPWFDVPRVVADHRRGAAVVLRRHVDEDAVRIAQACADPQCQYWLPGLPSPYTVADAVRYLADREEQHASGTGVYWAVADAEDDRLLGVVSLTDVDLRVGSAEVGYWVHPAERGRGVAATAARLAARHALLPAEDGGLGLHRVGLRVADGNTASQRAAQRAGFTPAGRDRSAEVLRDGSRRDFLRYDLLARELT